MLQPQPSSHPSISIKSYPRPINQKSPLRSFWVSCLLKAFLQVICVSCCVCIGCGVVGRENRDEGRYEIERGRGVMFVLGDRSKEKGGVID